MAPVKKESKEPVLSEFAKRRLENKASNSALWEDISALAEKVAPPKAGRLKSTATTRKKAAPKIKVEHIPTRATRSSLRLAGDDANGEVAKRKAEFDLEQEALQSKAKRQRIAGDLNLSDLVGDDKKTSSNGLVAGLIRGAEPYVRTFTEEDIKETTNESLKALRETMSGLSLYPDFEVNGKHRRQIR